MQNNKKLEPEYDEVAEQEANKIYFHKKLDFILQLHREFKVACPDLIKHLNYPNDWDETRINHELTMYSHKELLDKFLELELDPKHFFFNQWYSISLYIIQEDPLALTAQHLRKIKEHYPLFLRVLTETNDYNLYYLLTEKDEELLKELLPNITAIIQHPLSKKIHKRLMDIRTYSDPKSSTCILF
jgi:hypothetical protein